MRRNRGSSGVVPWLYNGRGIQLRLVNHFYGKRRVYGMGNSDVPDPDAFSHEGNANWVVVYKLGYLVKFLHRILAEQVACENGGGVLTFLSSVPLRPT